MGKQNPWVVENIEAFHFYCCPECDFQSKNGDYFKRHAMESHKKSKVFFLLSKSKNNDSMEFETEPEYQDENETTVKEQSISESESIETVILSEDIAQKLIDRPDYIPQDVENYENITDEETSEDETFDGIDEDLETFDEHDLEKTQTFNGQNVDNCIVEKSDKELEQEPKNFNKLKSEGKIEKAKTLVKNNYIVKEQQNYTTVVATVYNNANVEDINESKEDIESKNLTSDQTNKHSDVEFAPEDSDFDDESIKTESKKAEYCLTKIGKQGIKFGGHIFVKGKRTFSRATKERKRTQTGWSYLCSRLV